MYFEGKAREATKAENPKINRSRMKLNAFFKKDKSLTSRMILLLLVLLYMWKWCFLFHEKLKIISYGCGR